ncbi:MAG: DnaJ domain-containing protein [Kineosporiaceae bacterium]|nr:DnaJ domain-containing protein [Aeromicrobium sp.]
MSDKNYYASLGIDRSASNDEIRLAVREQRRRWTKLQSHPNLERRYEAELQVRAISEIEATLTDPMKRAAFDATLPPLVSAPPVFQDSVDPAPRERLDVPPVPDEDWLSLAEIACASGRWSGAHDAAAYATTIDPAQRHGWYIRLLTSLQLTERQAARLEAEQLLKLGPATAEHWAVIADAQAGDQRWEDAADAYRRAGQLDGSNPLHAAGEADMHSALGRPDLALLILERIVAENPRMAELQDQLADTLLDEAVGRWTQVDDDRFLTTEEQRRHTGNVIKRVRRLRIGAAETQDRLEQVSSWFNQGGTAS